MMITVSASPEPIKVDAAKSALVVVDMQNAFCTKGGIFDLMGKLEEHKVRPVIKKAQTVIDAFRKKNVRIIFLRMGYREDLADTGGKESPNYIKEGSLTAARKFKGLKNKSLTIGSWDWQIIDDIKPQPEDIIVDKNRFSGFPNTDFDIVLRTNNIKYLFFIGLYTNVCVESNIRDAFFHEYFPILIADSCVSLGPDFTEKATIWNVERVFGWVTTVDDIMNAFGPDVKSGKDR